MKVLICGDRNWRNPVPIARELDSLRGTYDIVINGGANGADTIAATLAQSMGFEVWTFPAQWDRHGRAAGPIRNQFMLEQMPDLVVAFHSDISRSKGTKDMVARARKAGVPTKVITE